MYCLLYLKNSIFNRLFLYFQDYFSNASKPTARNLFLPVISILTLDMFRSVRFAHSHVVSRLADTSLNAFYYTLETNAYDHSVWNNVTVSKAIQAVPGPLENQPLFLSIDDTMVEKSGIHFELCSKLHDHAAHNGSNYLNGHYMVSLLLSFPVYQDGKILYPPVPVGYRLWDKEKSKLALATKLADWHDAGAHQPVERQSGVCLGYCAKNGKGSRRLFLCTADPRTVSFDWENSADKTACSYGAENVFYLPLAWYGLRWNIMPISAYGTSRFRIMKGKPSGLWRNIWSAVKKGLSV